MKKKLFSILLCVCLLLSTLVLPLAVHAEEEADYMIYSISDLNQYAWAGSDKVLKLANDIVVPDGFTTLSGMTATLDGDGHTISGLKVPLFDGLKNATVKNLKISGSIAMNSNAGLLAKWTNYAVTLINCEATLTIDETGLDLSSESSKTRAGGFLGGVWESGPIKLTDCTVNGSIADKNKNIATVGGMIGIAEGVTVEMTGCVNNMDISETLAASASDSWNIECGGMIGLVQNGGSVKLTNCINNGTIQSYSTAGGMIAHCKVPYQLDGCINNGNITCVDTYNSGTNAGVGGMMCYAAGSVGKGDHIIKNCVNNGTLTSNSGTTNKGMAAGMTVSALKDAITYENCVNTGDIITNGYGGGMIANASSADTTLTFSNCAFTGSISSSLNQTPNGYVFYAGGLVAYMADNAKIGTISNCLVDGTIKGGNVWAEKEANGGLFGWWKYPAGTIENCVIAANIVNYNNQYAGAFVGLVDSWATVSELTVKDTYYETGKNTDINAFGMYRASGQFSMKVTLNYNGNSSLVDGTTVSESSNVEEYRAAWNDAFACAQVKNLKGFKAANAMKSVMGDTWLVTEGAPIPAALADVLLASKAQTAEIVYEGLQYTEDDGTGQMKVRFAASMSGLDYDAAGFEVVRIEKGTTPAKMTETSTSVYQGLTQIGEDGVTSTYTNFSGAYVTAIEVAEVPTDKTVTFVVKPLLDGAGDAANVDGMLWVAVFENGELVSQYQY